MRANRKEKAAERAAARARMEAAQAAARAVVAAGKCPQCGRKVRRNNALAGWWMCEQRGAEGFRADANAPACEWQGFTE